MGDPTPLEIYRLFEESHLLNESFSQLLERIQLGHEELMYRVKRAFEQLRSEFRSQLKEEVVTVADGGEDALLCVICIEKLAVGSETAVVLECNHKFHEECIMKWLNDMNKKTCPLCRCEVSA